MGEKKLRVLLVDDDPSFRLFTRRLCERIVTVGEIDEFEDIYDALRHLMLYKKNKTMLPDVILLDLDFPTLNGFEFLEDLVELESTLSKQIPIHVISSSHIKADRERADKFKMVKSFISKPITLEHIRKIFGEH